MDKQKFSQLLSEERTRRSYTQKQVAEALGVSDKTYSKWETGVNEMTVETLCRLAEFYGCSPAVFFAEERPAQGSPTQRDLKTMMPVQAFLYLREMIDEAYEVFSDFEWMRNPDPGADERLPILPRRGTSPAASSASATASCCGNGTRTRTCGCCSFPRRTGTPG